MDEPRQLRRSVASQPGHAVKVGILLARYTSPWFCITATTKASSLSSPVC